MDTREDVLQRLLEVVAGIENVRYAARNESDIPDTKLPAMLVFDADEETQDPPAKPSGRPVMMYMTPQIVVVQQANEVGSDLTTLRGRLIKAVTLDAELKTLVGTEGFISYRGCQTDFGFARSFQGGMIAHFVFAYVLRPDKF